MGFLAGGQGLRRCTGRVVNDVRGVGGLWITITSASGLLACAHLQISTSIELLVPKLLKSNLRGISAEYGEYLLAAVLVATSSGVAGGEGRWAAMGEGVARRWQVSGLLHLVLNWQFVMLSILAIRLDMIVDISRVVSSLHERALCIFLTQKVAHDHRLTFRIVKCVRYVLLLIVFCQWWPLKLTAGGHSWRGVREGEDRGAWRFGHREPPVAARSYLLSSTVLEVARLDWRGWCSIWTCFVLVHGVHIVHGYIYLLFILRDFKGNIDTLLP